MLSRIRRSMADKDQGFTLIELLVVIIIIGILAAIAIPVFLNQRKKAVDASLKSDLHHAAVILETWAVDHPGERVLPPYPVVETALYPGATDGQVMAGLKISPGNRITLVSSYVTVGAWCLFAANPNASTAIGGSSFMVWTSLTGGLDPAIVTDGGRCD